MEVLYELKEKVLNYKHQLPCVFIASFVLSVPNGSGLPRGGQARVCVWAHMPASRLHTRAQPPARHLGLASRARAAPDEVECGGGSGIEPEYKWHYPCLPPV